MSCHVIQTTKPGLIYNRFIDNFSKRKRRTVMYLLLKWMNWKLRLTGQVTRDVLGSIRTEFLYHCWSEKSPVSRSCSANSSKPTGDLGLFRRQMLVLSELAFSLQNTVPGELARILNNVASWFPLNLTIVQAGCLSDINWKRLIHHFY